MKAAIYLRTSTTEQHPEKQREPCLTFASGRGYDVHEIIFEQISAYKDVERPGYEKIKAMAHKGEIQAVIVWAIDRWIRNRDTLLEDITILRSYGCKLHSVQDAWLESINMEGPLGKTIQDFLLGLIGSLAELESQRKSERVKMAHKAYLKQDRKYKLWGRRPLPARVIKTVLELRSQGYDLRRITNEVSYYDKNQNLRKISIGSVHKIIKENMPEIDRLYRVSQNSPLMNR